MFFLQAMQLLCYFMLHPCNVDIIFYYMLFYTSYFIIRIKLYFIEVWRSSLGNSNLLFFICCQVNIFKGDKEEKHRGVFMHSLHHCTVKLSPLYLVWTTYCKLQVGEFPCGHYQWFRDPFRVFLHSDIFLVCFSKRQGKQFNLMSNWHDIKSFACMKGSYYSSPQKLVYAENVQFYFHACYFCI